MAAGLQPFPYDKEPSQEQPSLPWTGRSWKGDVELPAMMRASWEAGVPVGLQDKMKSPAFQCSWDPYDDAFRQLLNLTRKECERAHAVFLKQERKTADLSPSPNAGPAAYFTSSVGCTMAVLSGAPK